MRLAYTAHLSTRSYRYGRASALALDAGCDLRRCWRRQRHRLAINLLLTEALRESLSAVARIA